MRTRADASVRLMLLMSLGLHGSIGDQPSCVRRGDCELIQLHLVYRHGDRTPRTELPNARVAWTNGPGQLTGRGAMQMYKLGKDVRERYPIEVIGQHFDPRLAQMRSTDFDRTIASAQSVAYGVWSGASALRDEISNDLVLPSGYRPLPVHTVARLDDVLMLGDDNCPAFAEVVQQLLDSDGYQEKKRHFQPLVDKVRNITGFDATVERFYTAYDPIHVQHLHSVLALPAFNDELLRQVRTLGSWSEYQRHRGDVIGALGGGLLVARIAAHMRSAADGDSAVKRFYQYSAHDSTLMNVLAALRLDTAHEPLQALPPYASCIAFELYRHRSGLHSVGLAFKAGTDSDFVYYPPPRCRQLCPLRLFDEHARSVNATPSLREWCDLCGNRHSSACMVSRSDVAQHEVERIVAANYEMAAEIGLG